MAGEVNGSSQQSHQGNGSQDQNFAVMLRPPNGELIPGNPAQPLPPKHSKQKKEHAGNPKRISKIEPGRILARVRHQVNDAKRAGQAEKTKQNEWRGFGYGYKILGVGSLF